MRITSVVACLVILATVFFCREPLLAQRGSGGGVANALQALSDRIDLLETALALETTNRQNADALLATAIMDLETADAALEARTLQLEDLLTHFSVSGNDITISGANLHIVSGNLHIVNGTGNTETTNTFGNLIIGYNELRFSGNDRTGSHMLVACKV